MILTPIAGITASFAWEYELEALTAIRGAIVQIIGLIDPDEKRKCPALSTVVHADPIRLKVEAAYNSIDCQ